MLLTFLLSYLSQSEGQTPHPKISEPKNISIETFTTCDQFLNGTELDITKVVDVDWKIFYIWNNGMEKSYQIRFQLPNKMLVDRFKVELKEELNPPVNWTDAELFMETGIDFSALYLKTNLSGLYRIIPSVAFEFQSMPQMEFALKVVEPGYLGIVNCRYRLCYALAPVQNMPPSGALKEAAEKLGFWSELGYAYIEARPPPPAPLPDDYQRPEDDAEVDEQAELNMDPSKFNIF